MLNSKMIGSRIAEARKKLNISQAELARRMFISAQAVGKWERGESLPDIITLHRLAELLGVKLTYFSAQLSDTDKENNNELTPKDRSQDVSPVEKSIDPRSNTPGWNMSEGNWVDADFSGLKGLHEKFSGSNMQRCLFKNSELSGLILKGNYIERCDFSGSDFRRSHIQGSHLKRNKFIECSLADSEFSASHISGCDFTGADFSGVKIESGDFTKNTLENAIWDRTSFIASHLNTVVISGTVKSCTFELCSFNAVRFQNATIVNTFFKNKSLRRIRFVDCRADRLTYEFLKNGKADLSGIKLLERE